MGDITSEVFILALIYLKKILKTFDLTEGSFLAGMYSTCILIANKFLIEDEYWPIEEFSKMAGSSGVQIRQWELQILLCMDFELYVSKFKFENFRKRLLLSIN